MLQINGNKKLLEWNKIKMKLNILSKNINFHEREIWYISIGENIGFEQNGKGENFLRPVIILKKFNKEIFYGVPLTSKNKNSIFYYNFEFKKGKKSSAILSQIRLFDSKRLVRRYGMISKNFYNELKQKIKELLFE